MENKVKIGDKVRFLNDVGGGRVAGFQEKGIVLVEDEDGFMMPTLLTDVVVVEQDNYDLTRVAAQRVVGSSAPAPTARQKEPEQEPADRPVSFRRPAEERRGGDALSFYVAFVPIDIKEMTRTRFETYVVNDSNYYVRFCLLKAEGKAWQLKAEGEVEPNTKLFVEEFGREDLADMDHLCVQLMAYKRDKPFVVKPPVQTDLRIDAVKFYKLHTFRENDFFETPAIIHTIVENDKTARPLVVDARQLKEEMYRPAQTEGGKSASGTYVRRYDDRRGKGNPFVTRHKDGNEPLVVDLHANELLETTAGMGAADILNHQLDVFRRTLDEHAGEKGCRIVFIHGKGGGVLRQSIVHELKYRYKTYTYQDASFQEYGYGATQVTIR